MREPGWEIKKGDYIKGCGITTVTGYKVAGQLLFWVAQKGLV
jgi:hypothetical protein